MWIAAVTAVHVGWEMLLVAAAMGAHSPLSSALGPAHALCSR